MKNIFFTIAIFIILLSSCRNKSNRKTNTHIHDDGTEHIDHENGSVATPKQELFELEFDSLHIEKDTLNSEHETEHSHSHEGGHEHTH